MFSLYQDYQFWTRADEMGCFSINNIRPGDYNLYAWVPGFLGDYKSDVLVTITPGLSSRLVIDDNFLHVYSKNLWLLVFDMQIRLSYYKGASCV